MPEETESTQETEPKPVPSALEKTLDLSSIAAEERTGMLTDLLKTAAGRSGGAFQGAIDEFLDGKGELLNSARSSLTHGKTTAKKEIAAFLSEKFKLSAQVAKVIASLLIKMVPALGKLGGDEPIAGSKPRRKKKAAASKSTKKTTAKTKKKPATKKTSAAKKSTATKKASKKSTAKKSTGSGKKPVKKRK